MNEPAAAGFFITTYCHLFSPIFGGMLQNLQHFTRLDFHPLNLSSETLKKSSFFSVFPKSNIDAARCCIDWCNLAIYAIIHP
jgi:hypothetical protein